MSSPRQPRIYVLAGVNGAGKSSIAGAAFRQSGADYYNPDEAARRFMAGNPKLSLADANSKAWNEGLRRLKRAIKEGRDFAFETTLGGKTISRLLAHAASQGIEIYIWFAGLASRSCISNACALEYAEVATTFPKKIFAVATNIADSILSPCYRASQPCAFLTIPSRLTHSLVARQCRCWFCIWREERFSTRVTSRIRRTGRSL